jgi:hypothetical protein
MNEPLPILIENSVRIAWDYLERTGEIDDAAMAGKFLFDAIEQMVQDRLVSRKKSVRRGRKGADGKPKKLLPSARRLMTRSARTSNA